MSLSDPCLSFHTLEGRAAHYTLFGAGKARLKKKKKKITTHPSNWGGKKYKRGKSPKLMTVGVEWMRPIPAPPPLPTSPLPDRGEEKKEEKEKKKPTANNYRLNYQHMHRRGKNI